MYNFENPNNNQSLVQSPRKEENPYTLREAALNRLRAIALSLAATFASPGVATGNEAKPGVEDDISAAVAAVPSHARVGPATKIIVQPSGEVDTNISNVAENEDDESSGVTGGGGGVQTQDENITEIDRAEAARTLDPDSKLAKDLMNRDIDLQKMQ